MNFNNIYSCNNLYFSQNYSGGMAECLKKYSVSPCKAIDIGAGEGRNSLYLSEVGFDVIAIEPSEVGAKKIMQQSKDRNLEISVYQADFLSVAREFSNVGFVVSLTALEHMEYDYMLQSISVIKQIMKPGGYIYIVAFTEDDPGFKKDIKNASECAMFIKHYFKKDELRNLFSDFDILEYSEYMKEDSTHGPLHYHGKAKLVAQKPTHKIG